MGCNQYNIREYLEKFWSGETTLEEEKNIKNYFAFNEVPDDLKSDAAYFENIIFSLDDDFLGDDFDAGIVSMMEKNKHPKGALVFLKSPIFRWAVAAIFIVAMGVVSWNSPKSSKVQPVAENKKNTSVSLQEFNAIQSQLEKNASFTKTKNTFLLIGNKMNKVIKHAEKLNRLNQIENKN